MRLGKIWGLSFISRGYHGKRDDGEQTRVIKSPEKLAMLVQDPKLEVISTQVTDDENYVVVCFKNVKEEANRNGSIVIALMATAYARIALYKVLIFQIV